VSSPPPCDATGPNTGPPQAPETADRPGEVSGRREQVLVVGLGNPEPRYRDTRHNVGCAVVDALAASRRLRWERACDAWIACTAAPDPELTLVKLDAHVNESGAALRALLEARRWNSAECILVHDDLDLPLGKVKVRMGGSAGGHRGVASILEAFQTNAMARVKVGVGTPRNRADAARYVLEPFTGDALPFVRHAQVQAVARVLSLAAARHGTGWAADSPRANDVLNADAGRRILSKSVRQSCMPQFALVAWSTVSAPPVDMGGLAGLVLAK
jgi:PTH1 family peptidyl-tRNA hydrolase